MKSLLSSQCTRNLSELLENKIQVNWWPVVSAPWEQSGRQDWLGVYETKRLKYEMGPEHVNAQGPVVTGQRSILGLLWSKSHQHGGHSKSPPSSDPGADFHEPQLNSSEDN